MFYIHIYSIYTYILYTHIFYKHIYSIYTYILYTYVLYTHIYYIYYIHIYAIYTYKPYMLYIILYISFSIYTFLHHSCEPLLDSKSITSQVRHQYFTSTQQYTSVRSDTNCTQEDELVADQSKDEESAKHFFFYLPRNRTSDQRARWLSQLNRKKFLQPGSLAKVKGHLW